MKASGNKPVAPKERGLLTHAPKTKQHEKVSSAFETYRKQSTTKNIGCRLQCFLEIQGAGI